ncbi:MAG: DUF2029 domain-containing protein [Anaerolineales bacterium]|nr:DUF2029 domain-containing protein [Anaerolineales bacterium]
MLRELRNRDIKLSPKALDIFHHVMAGMILLFFVIAIAATYWDILPPRKDLYNELWGPTYLLMQGKSPYNTSSLNPILPAAWLPMSIGFFAPLGWLSEEVALRFWFLFSLVEMALVVFLIRRGDKSIINLFLLSIFAFSFPSTIYHLLLGQFSITTTLCVVTAVYLILKESHWLAAFLLALGLSKLHLMTLPMLGLSILYYQRSGIKSMFVFWERVFVACLVLCTPLFIAYPNWIPDAIQSMTSNAPWAFPNLQKFLIYTFGSVGMIIWGVAVALSIMLSLFLWKRLDPIPATFWNVGLALLISPYIGSWDFVTLLPLWLYTFSAVNRWQKVFMLISYIIAWLLMANIQGLEESHNHFFWWVPLWFLASTAIVTIFSFPKTRAYP